MTRHEVQKINGKFPTDKILWRSVHHEDFQRPIRTFLWLMMHNAHKVGDYWVHKAKNKEHWANCNRCGVEDSMDHILTECEAPEVKTIWNLAEKLWKMKMSTWPGIRNAASILACGLADFRSPNGKKLTGANRLYRIIIFESAHLIWKIRCMGLFETDPEKPEITEKEIHNKWIKMINLRLELDKALTNDKFQEKSMPRRKVLQTWRNTIENEKKTYQWTGSNQTGL